MEVYVGDSSHMYTYLYASPSKNSEQTNRSESVSIGGMIIVTLPHRYTGTLAATCHKHSNAISNLKNQSF